MSFRFEFKISFGHLQDVFARCLACLGKTSLRHLVDVFLSTGILLLENFSWKQALILTVVRLTIATGSKHRIQRRPLLVLRGTRMPRKFERRKINWKVKSSLGIKKPLYMNDRFCRAKCKKLVTIQFMLFFFVSNESIKLKVSATSNVDTCRFRGVIPW